MRTPASVAVVGLGRRGAQLARAFDELPNADLRGLCDTDPQVRLAQQRRFPLTSWAQSFDELLVDDALDAVVIATPAHTHYDLALRALRADKHVMIERPLTVQGEDARELVSEARRQGRVLMVANDWLDDPAVEALKEYIHTGALGDIYYIDAKQQAAEGQHEQDVLSSLGPSALALLLALLDDQPIDVSARGDAYVRPGIHDMVFCYLRFATGIVATLHLSSLEARAVNHLSVVGAGGTASVDIGNVDRPLTIYNTRSSSARYAPDSKPVKSRLGDVVSPQLPDVYSLEIGCERFARMVGSHPSAALDANGAVTAVEVLEALHRSLAADGRTELVDSTAVTLDVTPRPLLAAVPGERRSS